MPTPSDVVELDVREMPPRERHPRIFEVLDGLSAGSSLELTNDHDPKPLYYQIQMERPGKFDWHYLDEGPEVWRVRITRTPNQ